MVDKTNKKPKKISYSVSMLITAFFVFVISLAFTLSFMPDKVPELYEPLMLGFLAMIPLFNPILLICIVIVLSLMGAESFYIEKSKKLVVKKGQDKKVSLVLLKVKSFFAGPFIAFYYTFLVIVVLFYLEVFTTLIFYDWLQFLISIGIAALTVFIIWLNVEFVGMKHARDETDKEYKARMKKEKALKKLEEEEEKAEEKRQRDKFKPMKFKIGEKVRVKKNATEGSSITPDKFAGKIVMIANLSKSDKTYEIRERFNWYDEEELIKIKKKSK